MVPTGLLILAFAGRGAVGLGYFFVFTGTVVLSNIVTVVAHELGHATLAHLVGMRVVAITIGSGPPLTSGRWRDVKVELRQFLLTGGVTAVYDPSPHPAKWRHALMLTGGVLGNIAVAALVTLMLALLATLRSPNMVVVTVGFAVVTGQVFAIVRNLLPRTVHIGWRVASSDGKGLFNLVVSKDFREQQLAQRAICEGRVLLEKQQYDLALAHFQQACAVLPSRGDLLSLLIHTLGKARGPRPAMECYCGRAQALVLASAADRAGAAWTSVNGAWHALLCGDQASVSLADRLSRQAVEALPGISVVQATRGAVLVELGEHEAGLRLLMPAIRRVESREDRLCFVPFLAKGERARGNFDMALEFENFGRHLAGAA